MKHSNALKTYIRRVRSGLTCKRSTKEKLISGLLDELSGQSLTTTYAQLIENFGTPDAVAAQMQQAVSEQERCAAEQRAWGAADCLCGCVCPCFAWLSGKLCGMDVEHRTDKICRRNNRNTANG